MMAAHGHDLQAQGAPAQPDVLDLFQGVPSQNAPALGVPAQGVFAQGWSYDQASSHFNLVLAHAFAAQQQN